MREDMGLVYEAQTSAVGNVHRRSNLLALYRMAVADGDVEAAAKADAALRRYLLTGEADPPTPNGAR